MLFNSNHKPTQTVEKKQFIDLVKQSQTLWNTEGKQKQSLNLLRQALALLDAIITKETNPEVKKIYASKQPDLKKRLSDREEGKQKPKPKTENTDKHSEEQIKKNMVSWFLYEKPNIKWSDISGLQTAKKALEESLILPIKFPQVFNKKKPCTSVLILGPYGAGKSMLVKALINETNLTFFSVCPSDFIYKFHGNGGPSIKVLFSVAKQTFCQIREKQPSVVLIDQVEAMCGDKINEKYRNLKTQFMAQMNEIDKNDSGVIIIAESHQPWLIDDDLQKMFQLRLHTPLPDFNERLEMLKKNLQQTPHNLTEADFVQFAKATEYYTGSDLNILTREAMFQPVRKIQLAKKFKLKGSKWTPCKENEDGKTASWRDFKNNQLQIQQITKDDVMHAMLKTKPCHDQKDRVKYQKFYQKFSQYD